MSWLRVGFKEQWAQGMFEWVSCLCPSSYGYWPLPPFLQLSYSYLIVNSEGKKEKAQAQRKLLKIKNETSNVWLDVIKKALFVLQA